MSKIASILYRVLPSVCVVCLFYAVAHVHIESKLVHYLINEAYVPKQPVVSNQTSMHDKAISISPFSTPVRDHALDAQRSYPQAAIVNFDNNDAGIRLSEMHDKTFFVGSALADAYDKMLLTLLQEPRTNLRFLIFENSRAGVGNKLRGLGGALLIALKHRRILLLGEKMYWFADYYSDGLSNWLVNRVHAFNISIDRMALKYATKHEIPFGPWQRFVREAKNQKIWYCNWGSIPHDLHTLEIWDGCFGIPPGPGWQRTRFLNPMSPCPKNKCAAQADGSVRNLYFITCWQIANLALVRASDRFVKEIRKFKDSLQWEIYDTRLGLQIRACVDCGHEDATNETFITNSIKCIEEQVLELQAARGNKTKIAVYCATDKASWIPKVTLALEHTGVTVLSHGPRSKFTQTAKGGSFLKVLPPMLDFHMLGETASIVVPHFTSFSNLAAARTRRMLYTGSTTNVGARICKPVFSDVFVKNTPMYSNAHCAPATAA